MNLETQLSTKDTKWGKQAFRRKAKARKSTNRFITNITISSHHPKGELPNMSDPLAYFVAFVFFVDEKRF
jgi:hypothetical protein